MSTISPEQCRAGRAWLGWTQEDLASRAGVGQSTVKDFEGGIRKPISNNRTAIERALKEAGISCGYGDDGTATGIAWIGDTRGAQETTQTPQAPEPGKPRGGASRGRRGK